MTRKRLYTLTDDQASIIAHALNVAEDHASITRETKDMMRGTALIPLDRDAAVGRMARALCSRALLGWAHESAACQNIWRDDARAVLGALLKDDEA